MQKGENLGEERLFGVAPFLKWSLVSTFVKNYKFGSGIGKYS